MWSLLDACSSACYEEALIPRQWEMRDKMLEVKSALKVHWSWQGLYFCLAVLSFQKCLYAFLLFFNHFSNCYLVPICDVSTLRQLVECFTLLFFVEIIKFNSFL